MTLAKLHTKLDESRRKRELTRIENERTIHWRARAKGFTSDDIEAGTPCTVKLAVWTEGPATVVKVHRGKYGRVWKLEVRPEFDTTAGRYDKPWTFTCSSSPAVRRVPTGGATYRLAPNHDFYAFRYGNPETNPITWEHRRLLVGHADIRNPDLTRAVVAHRESTGVLYAGEGALAARMRDDEFYATTEHGITTFMRARGLGAAARDAEESLLLRRDGMLLATVDTTGGGYVRHTDINE